MNEPAIEVFFDGQCPLCRREIEFLQRRDRDGRIGFTDISADDFDATLYGMTQRDFMSRIHGRLPDGRMIDGVDVFRHLYRAAGFGWLVSITSVPGVSHALDAAYRWFARHRLRLTGRCPQERCDLSTPKNDNRLGAA